MLAVRGKLRSRVRWRALAEGAGSCAGLCVEWWLGLAKVLCRLLSTIPVEVWQRCREKSGKGAVQGALQAAVAGVTLLLPRVRWRSLAKVLRRLLSRVRGHCIARIMLGTYLIVHCELLEALTVPWDRHEICSGRKSMCSWFDYKFSSVGNMFLAVWIAETK